MEASASGPSLRPAGSSLGEPDERPRMAGIRPAESAEGRASTDSDSSEVWINVVQCRPRLRSPLLRAWAKRTAALRAWGCPCFLPPARGESHMRVPVLYSRASFQSGSEQGL